MRCSRSLRRKTSLSLLWVIVAILLAGQSAPGGQWPPPAGWKPTPSDATRQKVEALDSTYFIHFDDFADGTTAEQLTVSGVTFSSNPASSWHIAPAFFTGLTGKILFQPNTPGSLDITFASPITSFSLDFAQNSTAQGATSLVVEAFSGGSAVGSAMFPTTFIGQTFAEGAVSFAGRGPFNRIRLSSNPASTLIAIDNIRVPAGANPLEILSFTASPNIIRRGGSTTLAWRTTNATALSIDNGVGTQVVNGSATVSPQQTTTYTLTATNGPLSSRATVLVEVIANPVVSATSLPQALLQTANAGGATTSYVLTNAGAAPTTITLAQSGNFFTQSPASFALQPGGSQVVTLTGLAQSAGAFEGSSIPTGSGVPAGLSIRVRLLSAAAPSGSVVGTTATTRVTISAPAGSSPTGTVRFSNSGTSTLTGILTSDATWLIPPAGIVTIPPGGSVEVTFTIDRSKRPDANELLGAVTANLTLTYLTGPAGKVGAFNGGSSSSSTSVQDNVTVTPVSSQPAPLAAGEVALFVPAIGTFSFEGRRFTSDISLANLLSSANLANIKLYYSSRSGIAATSLLSTIPQLFSNQATTFTHMLSLNFGKPDESGTLQARLAQPAQLAMHAKVSSNGGTVGAFVPLFRSDRAAAAAQKVFLPGLVSPFAGNADLFLQEALGSTASVRIDFYAAGGTPVGSPRTETLEPFRLRHLTNAVPAGAASAIVTGVFGQFLAYGMTIGGTDLSSVVDWSRHYQYVPSEPVLVPFVAGAVERRRTALRVSPGAVAHGIFTGTDLVIMNATDAAAAASVRYIPASGAPVDRSLAFGPRESKILPEVLSTLFGVRGDSFGAVTLSPTTGSFAITSRTYTARGATGMTVPAIALSSGVRLGDTQRIGPIDDARAATITAAKPATSRTTLGLVETAGAAATVRVTMHYTTFASDRLASKGSASKEYTLTPRQMLLIERISRELLGVTRDSFLPDLTNLVLDVAVTAGTGSVVPFTISIDSASGDSVFRID